MTVSVWPEAGKMLGVSKPTAYEMARTGQIPTIRVGRKILVPLAPLRKMLGITDAVA